MHYLAEEQAFKTVPDEQFTGFEEADWDADPMTILMAKQERERDELLDSLPRH